MTTIVREISPELRELIERFADNYTRSAEIAEQIVKLGEKEGLTKQDIHDLVKEQLEKRKLKDRRIRELLSEHGLTDKKRDGSKQKLEISQQYSGKKENPDAAESAASKPDTQMQPPVPTFEKGEIEEIPPANEPPTAGNHTIELNLSKYYPALAQSYRQGRARVFLVHDGNEVVEVKYS